MISLIYGPKGSRKTLRIIEEVNGALQESKGNIVYITDQPKHSTQINTAIRFIDRVEYQVNSCEQAIGFIKGILASNNDISSVYIDGLARMCNQNVSEMEAFYNELEKVGDQDKVKFVLTVSTEKLPDYLQKYV